MSEYRCPNCDVDLELDEHDDGYVCECSHEEHFSNPYAKYDAQE